MQLLAGCFGERLGRGNTVMFGLRALYIPSYVRVSLIIVLVGLSSFAFGWLAASQQGREVPVLEKTELRPGDQTGLYVASRHSDKFHFAWCAGAKRIVERNRIAFASEKEARAAGYTPAKNCPGLNE